jgi:hypothetical protein
MGNRIAVVGARDLAEGGGAQRAMALPLFCTVGEDCVNCPVKVKFPGALSPSEGAPPGNRFVISTGA